MSSLLCRLRLDKDSSCRGNSVSLLPVNLPPVTKNVTIVVDVVVDEVGDVVIVGVEDGTIDGIIVGVDDDGSIIDGIPDGTKEGSPDGTIEGPSDGISDGPSDGINDGVVINSASEISKPSPLSLSLLSWKITVGVIVDIVGGMVVGAASWDDDEEEEDCTESSFLFIFFTPIMMARSMAMMTMAITIINLFLCLLDVLGATLVVRL